MIFIEATLLVQSLSLLRADEIVSALGHLINIKENATIGPRL
jgi:hypothetical protein